MCGGWEVWSTTQAAVGLDVGVWGEGKKNWPQLLCSFFFLSSGGISKGSIQCFNIFRDNGQVLRQGISEVHFVFSWEHSVGRVSSQPQTIT